MWVMSKRANPESRYNPIRRVSIIALHGVSKVIVMNGGDTVSIGKPSPDQTKPGQAGRARVCSTHNMIFMNE